MNKSLKNIQAAFAPDKLTIEYYNTIEAAIKKTLPYFAIREFSPKHFHAVGFPVAVGEESELSQFADIMYEFEEREKMYWQLTRDECDMILRLENIYKELSGLRPFLGFVSNIKIFRMIESIQKRMKGKAKILEIGCGSGFLGAMCIDQKWNYSAGEITQSLYLWQNRIFSKLSEINNQPFFETAGEPLFIQRDGVQHLPWWHLAYLYNTLPNYDIIVCDRALAEMSMFARKYYLTTAKKLVRNSAMPCFLYTSAGFPHFCDENGLKNEFVLNGWQETNHKNAKLWTLPYKDPAFAYLEETSPSIVAADVLKYEIDELAPSHQWVESLEWNKTPIDIFMRRTWPLL